MSNKIEAALTAEEWAFLQPTPTLIVTESETLCAFPDPGAMRIEANGIDVYDDPAAIIAVANAMLKKDDARKITRETVSALLKGAVSVEYMCAHRAELPEDFRRYAPMLRHLADTLESYLPPRTGGEGS